MPVSNAQKKSAKKYQDKNNKRFGIIMKKPEGETLEKYLKDNKYTVNGFIVQAIKEKIERGTGKSFDEFLKGSKSKAEEDQEQNNTKTE